MLDLLWLSSSWIYFGLEVIIEVDPFNHPNYNQLRCDCSSSEHWTYLFNGWNITGLSEELGKRKYDFQELGPNMIVFHMHANSSFSIFIYFGKNNNGFPFSLDVFTCLSYIFLTSHNLISIFKNQSTSQECFFCQHFLSIIIYQWESWKGKRCFFDGNV